MVNLEIDIECYLIIVRVVNDTILLASSLDLIYWVLNLTWGFSSSSSCLSCATCLAIGSSLSIMILNSIPVMLFNPVPFL